MKSFSEFTDIHKGIKVEETSYDKLTPREVADFVKLVMAGGQRLGGTKEGMKNAKVLYMLRDAENKIIGGSAIKEGKRWEVQEILERIGLDFNEEVGQKELLEFGLSVIDPEYRGMKLIDLLYAARIEYIKKNFPDAYCFCTIRNGTSASIKAALRNHFVNVGEYQSLYGEHYLSLFKLVIH